MGIAGCRWYLPINGTTNSSWAGKPAGQVGTLGNWWMRGHWQLLCRPIWQRSNWLYDRVTVPLDLPALINALGPNDRIRFVSVKFVRIIGERSR